jgi:divalent metal cation (Fe/Co/Zn/Cd) transporter
MLSIDPPDESLSEKPSVMRVAVYSLLFNLILVGTKFMLSAMTGSLALRADAPWWMYWPL